MVLPTAGRVGLRAMGMTGPRQERLQNSVMSTKVLGGVAVGEGAVHGLLQNQTLQPSCWAHATRAARCCLLLAGSACTEFSEPMRPMNTTPCLTELPSVAPRAIPRFLAFCACPRAPADMSPREAIPYWCGAPLCRSLAWTTATGAAW